MPKHDYVIDWEEARRQGAAIVDIWGDVSALPPEALESIGDLANDVMATYGDRAKGFALAMITRSMRRRDPETEDLWMKVGAIIWEADPIPSAGCPAEVAKQFKLN